MVSLHLHATIRHHHRAPESCRKLGSLSIIELVELALVLTTRAGSILLHAQKRVRVLLAHGIGDVVNNPKAPLGETLGM